MTAPAAGQPTPASDDGLDQGRGPYPPYDTPDYRSTHARAPRRPLIALPDRFADVQVPLLGHDRVREGDHDLTCQHAGEPIGERIRVAGRVLDVAGRPVRGALVELWQANSAGRYLHRIDQHDAPLDPNFTGVGRCLTDDEGRYLFVTVKPGAYPWGNHADAWRPAHIHLSLFGRLFSSRLITQMYFPGDPLLALDPIYQSVPDPKARARLLAAYDPAVGVEGQALGYRFDIVLRGRDATPFED